MKKVKPLKDNKENIKMKNILSKKVSIEVRKWLISNFPELVGKRQDGYRISEKILAKLSISDLRNLMSDLSHNQVLIPRFFTKNYVEDLLNRDRDLSENQFKMILSTIADDDVFQDKIEKITTKWLQTNFPKLLNIGT